MSRVPFSFEVLGTGTAIIDKDGGRRIVGTVNGEADFHEPPPPVAFTITRPAAPVVDVFTTRYRFDFTASPSGCDPPSHAVLDLAFAADGHGAILATAADHGIADTVFGRFQPGACILAPSGRVACASEYRHLCNPPPDFSSPVDAHHLVLDGQLSLGVDGVTGMGEVDVSPFLFFPFGHRRWSARALP